MKIKFEFDLERFIDDFIFLCFFVGNDFIPNLPSLKIREGAIDALLFIYKNEIINFDYYITEGNGKINLNRAQKILEKLGAVEESFLRSYTSNKNYYDNRNKDKINKKDILYEKFNLLKDKNNKNNPEEKKLGNKDEINIELNEDADINRKDSIDQDILKISEKTDENFKRIFKEYLKDHESKKVSAYVDNVRLGENGYKERYYQEKFKTSYNSVEFRDLIKQSYIEGICWVFSYYYNGCCSWGWYYPFHYAPFASDLLNISELDIKFDLGEPFKPVEQLLSVLPPYSSNALPECLRKLMHYPESEIIDFFPKDIQLDVNGHPFSWMGVNLIPFVDEERIRIVVDKYSDGFNEVEKSRNNFGTPLVLFNSKENILKNFIGENFKENSVIVNISTPNFRIFSGILTSYDDAINRESTYVCNLKGLSISVVKDSKIGVMKFENAESKPHFSRLLNGIMIPQKIVLEDNLEMYNKRGFRGEQTIKLINSILKYQNEIENEFKNSLFDRSFNNNRAVEYNPADLEMIKKKRYREGNTNNYNSEQNLHQNKNYANNNQNNRNNRNQSYDGNNDRNRMNINNNNNNNNYNNQNFQNQSRPNQGNINYNNNQFNQNSLQNNMNFNMQNKIPQINLSNAHYMNNPNFNPNLPPMNNSNNYQNISQFNNNVHIQPNNNVNMVNNQIQHNNTTLNVTNPNMNVKNNSMQNLASTYQIYKGKNQNYK